MESIEIELQSACSLLYQNQYLFFSVSIPTLILQLISKGMSSNNEQTYYDK